MRRTAALFCLNLTNARCSREKGQKVWRVGQHDQGDEEGGCSAVSVCSPGVVESLTRCSGHYKTGVKPLDQAKDIRNAVKNLSDDLPPMNEIEAMFDHLVSRVSQHCVSTKGLKAEGVQVPDLVKLVERLNGRKLRVATMCSYVNPSDTVQVTELTRLAEARNRLCWR